MKDFVSALGLLLVIEGALYTLFPEGVQKMGRSIQKIPLSSLRAGGVAAAVAGVVLVWLIRGTV